MKARLGRKLRELRRERGLSQADLAERAEVTPEYVSRIERGQVGPSMEALDRFAKALGVEPRMLFDFAVVKASPDPVLLQIIELVRHASPEDKKLVLRLAETVVKYRRPKRPG